jgi:TolB-like protein
MHRHLHSRLPVEQLDQVPQPAIVLIEALMEKDPASRFRNPTELLKAIETVSRAIKARRTVSRLRLAEPLVHGSSSGKTESSAIRVPKRSIAVLPFDTLSDGKKDTYFADGVHDEILSHLAKLSQLKVISRTSAMTYRSEGNRDVRSIATALRVANVVEGTVRRDGNRIRITIRLVAARSDKTIWSETYDRDLTDIFGIQSEIAQMIASKLSASFSPEEKKRIERKPTNNLEAYDLYLQAKQLIESTENLTPLGGYEAPVIEAISLLEQAIQLDPSFSLAYCAAAKANDWLYCAYDPSLARLAMGDEAIRRALSLEPVLPEVHLACAHHFYSALRDYERARLHLTLGKGGLPNSSEAAMIEARMDRRQGNWDKAVEQLNKAVTLDPRNVALIAELGLTFHLMRHFSAAERAYSRAIAIAPDQPMFKVLKATYVTYMMTGDTGPLRAGIEALPRWTADEPDVIIYHLNVALRQQDWNRAEELIEKIRDGKRDFAYAEQPVPTSCYSILLARLKGELFEADCAFSEARNQLAEKVQISQGDFKARLLSQLAVVDALLGKPEDAIAEAKGATAILPVSKDAVHGPAVLKNLAVVYAWTNELDFAFDTLAPLTKTPNGIYYGDFKLNPLWEPLRKDSRFDKLLSELAPKD